MNTLANSYEAAGRQHDALKLREETLALFKNMKATSHPEHPGPDVQLGRQLHSCRATG